MRFPFGDPLSLGLKMAQSRYDDEILGSKSSVVCSWPQIPKEPLYTPVAISCSIIFSLVDPPLSLNPITIYVFIEYIYIYVSLHTPP